MALRPFRGRFNWQAAAIVVGSVAAAALAGCSGAEAPKAAKPVPYALVSEMQRSNMKGTSQIFIRIFKETSELEVWKQTQNGTFALLKTYDICKWSGVLGPKKKEGDRQAPEGFYTVTPAQMNPNSSYYLSFNIGYPNRFDQAHGRTGSNLMVHGACSSAGCYSMTDESAGELFALARDSFRGGQTNFQIQAFPFRMTPENLARHRDDPNMEFWRMLKVGYDHFEITRKPPKVDVCNRGYVFDADAGGASFSNTGACPPYTVAPSLVAALEKKKAADDATFATAVAALEEKDRAAEQAAQVAAAEAAEREQRAAEKAAVAEARAAERAGSPSLVTRLLNGVGIGVRNTPMPPAVDPAPVASVPAPAASAPVAMAVPVLRPTGGAPNTPAPAPAPQPVAAASTASEPLAASATAEAPPPGTVAKKRKFLWWDDQEAAAPPS